MSVVTNVIITYPVWVLPAQVDVLNTWLREHGHGNLVAAKAESEKHLEVTVLVGAFNYLDHADWLLFLNGLDWEFKYGACGPVRPHVRVGLQGEHEEHFSFATLLSEKSS